MGALDKASLGGGPGNNKKRGPPCHSESLRCGASSQRLRQQSVSSPCCQRAAPVTAGGWAQVVTGTSTTWWDTWGGHRGTSSNTWGCFQVRCGLDSPGKVFRQHPMKKVKVLTDKHRHWVGRKRYFQSTYYNGANKLSFWNLKDKGWWHKKEWLEQEKNKV